MSRDKSDGNMISSSIPSSFEKRLMALEFDIKRKNENTSSKALSDEIERLELEQLKQKKVLKSVESNLKKFEKKFDSGSQDLHDNKSVASSKRSGKSKADRKIEKEIEKMKENYGSIKSEIGIKLNDQSEFIEEMANMKAKLESVSSTFKVEVRSLKSDMEDIKTKVIDPLTSKCAKLITETAKKEDLKEIKKELKELIKMKDRGDAKNYNEEIIERWDNYTENMNAKMKDFETKISSKLKKMSTNSADQESMVLLVEKLTTNIKSETAEIVSKLKDKVSADLYEQNAKASFILDGSKLVIER